VGSQNIKEGVSMVKMKDKNNTMRFLSILMVWMLVCVGFAGINIVVDEVSANEPQEESIKSSSRALANSPWPMFRGNLRHTGLSPYDTSTNPGKLKWKFETGGFVVSSPAIGSDGTIYVGSFDGGLYAINPNGTEKWNFTTSQPMESSPAIGSDGVIYVGSKDYKLYAINPNGTEKWNFLTADYVDSSPAIASDDTIYVGSLDGNLYAIYPNGTEKWRFSTGSSIKSSSPAIGSDGTVYVGNGGLWAIYPNGTKKWKFNTLGYVDSSPSIDSNGTIYVGSADNELYAIYPNGTKKWSYTTGNLVLASPALGSDGTIYVGSHDLKLYAINPDGTKKWHYITGFKISSSPAISSEGTIYFGSDDKYLYAIDPKSNGTQKWRFLTGNTITSSPAIGPDGTVYVGSEDHNLYAIGIPNKPPIANAGPDHYVKVDQTVYFNQCTSFDPNSDPLTHKWDFGDGNSTGWQSERNATHAYTKAGNYTVSFTVSDDFLTDTDTCYVIVTDDTPMVPLIKQGFPTDILLDEDFGEHQLDLSDFKDHTNPNVNENNLIWQVSGNSDMVFNQKRDNNTGPNVFKFTSIVNKYGIEYLTYHLFDQHGMMASINQTVTVRPINDIPIADAGPDQIAYTGKTVYFDGSKSYDIDDNSLQYWWDFGDGGTVSGSNLTHAEHIYEKVGEYKVYLNVSDGEGYALDFCIVQVYEKDNKFGPFIKPIPDMNINSYDPNAEESGAFDESYTFDFSYFVEDPDNDDSELSIWLTSFSGKLNESWFEMDNSRNMAITFKFPYSAINENPHKFYINVIDPDQNVAFRLFNVTVVYDMSPIELIKSIPDQYLIQGGESENAIYLWDYFNDIDGGTIFSLQIDPDSKLKADIDKDNYIDLSTTDPNWHTGNSYTVMTVVAHDSNPVQEVYSPVRVFVIPLDETDKQNHYWLSIVEVIGGTISISDMKFKCYTDDGLLLFEKTIADANPTSFTKGESIIYPIPTGSAAVDDGSGSVVNYESLLRDYSNCTLAFIDQNNDGITTPGDSFFLYIDNDADFYNEIKAGYLFQIYDKKDKRIGEKTLPIDNSNLINITLYLEGEIPDDDPDTDNDGMPDIWEIQYGLNPNDPTDALNDPDHDGLNNLMEYMLNTNPLDKDTDGDGYSDNNDAFPTDDAAAVDSDGDKFPDNWNDGKSADDSTTGLTLDEFPDNPNKHAKPADDKGYGLETFSIFIIVLIIIIILIMVQLFVTVLRKKRTDSDLPVYENPEVNNVIRELYQTAEEPESELLDAEIMAKLTQKYQNGEISKNTHDEIVANVLNPQPANINPPENLQIPGRKI
jgi:outer membrane protein assembly factor BamB